MEVISLGRMTAAEIGGPYAADLAKFCAGVSQEDALTCLGKSMEKPGFNPGCKMAMMNMGK